MVFHGHSSRTWKYQKMLFLTPLIKIASTFRDGVLLWDQSD